MNPPRVLVVDDNQAVRELWCAALTMLGYEPVPAEDGASALALFDAAAFDLVVTDLLMPGMSGWQVVEAIASRSSTPVVVITASDDEGDVKRARAQGIPLLRKPVRLLDLAHAVEDTLLGRRIPAF